MEYEGFEFTELSTEEILAHLRSRLKTYEEALFTLVMDRKADQVSVTPDVPGALRMSHQISNLSNAIKMVRGEISSLEGGEEDGEVQTTD